MQTKQNLSFNNFKKDDIEEQAQVAAIQYLKRLEEEEIKKSNKTKIKNRIIVSLLGSLTIFYGIHETTVDNNPVAASTIEEEIDTTEEEFFKPVENIISVADTVDNANIESNLSIFDSQLISYIVTETEQEIILEADVSDSFDDFMVLLNEIEYMPAVATSFNLDVVDDFNGYDQYGNRKSMLEIFISESEKNNLMQQAGIKPDDYQYVDYIIQRESNWRPFVWNQQGSSAYGLCQSMQSVWKDTWADDFMTNPVSQLKWCNWYAFDRYGSWQKAYEFWKQNHWW